MLPLHLPSKNSNYHMVSPLMAGWLAGWLAGHPGGGISWWLDRVQMYECSTGYPEV